MIKRMSVAVFLLFAILLFMLPKTDDASKRKMASAAMLMCSNEFRNAVASQLLEGGEISARFDNHCPELIASLGLDEAGEITLNGAKHGIVITLTPEVASGEVQWHCQGKPATSITKLCKP